MAFGTFENVEAFEAFVLFEPFEAFEAFMPFETFKPLKAFKPLKLLRLLRLLWSVVNCKIFRKITPTMPIQVCTDMGAFYKSFTLNVSHVFFYKIQYICNTA